MRFILLFLLMLPGTHAAAMHDDVLNSFVTASSKSELQLRGSSMSIDIVAQVPKLDKTAALQGIRAVSAAGVVSYSSLQLTGDTSVRHQIIARYLAADENAAGEHDLKTLALTTENYKFHFLSVEDLNGTSTYLFRVKPRHKREGSFDGNLWIDAKTNLPLRESGRVIQHSIFLRRLTMVRRFRVVDHTAIPERTDIEIDTRLVGKAQLTVKLSPLRPGIEQVHLLPVSPIPVTAVQ